jgi:PAS domain S-box-containing protein
MRVRTARPAVQQPTAVSQQPAIIQRAASTLAWVMGGLGVLLMVTAALQLFGVEVPRGASIARLLLGLALVAGAAVAAWLLARGQPHAANALQLTLAFVGAGVTALAVGVGLSGVAIPGVCVLIVTAGLLTDQRTVSWLTLLYFVIIGALGWAESSGSIAGSAALHGLSLGDRITNLALLGAVAWVSALLARHLVGESLAQAERESARMASFVRLGSDWAWEMDAKGHLTWLSPSFEERTGRTVAEFLRTNEPGGPQALPRGGIELMRDAMKERRPYRNLSVAFLCTDGAVLHVCGSGEPRFDDAGRLTGWWGVSRNVTEEVLGQRARQHQQHLLDGMVSTSPDGLCVARVKDGRIQLTNQSFLDLVGCTEAEAMGHNALELGLWRDRDSALALRNALRAAPVVRDLRSEGWSRDGTRRDLLISAAAFDWDGEPVAVIIVRDVTELHRAEAELAEAKRLADQASAAKSAFLATMSHEIRTPLNGVMGLARLLQEPTLAPQRRTEYLGHLIDAAEGLAGIVSDVLDLSKIEAGELKIDQIVFDLRDVVASTFHTFAPLGREHGLVMHCTVDRDVPERVSGDPVRVRQIVANFLSNALKFTAVGSIGLLVENIDGGLIRVAVHDTGPGVDPELRERLFRPFAQADSSTTRRFGGTGLGLSICRDLAERMGGSVGVDSLPGEGSRFWAELPLPAAETPAPAGLPPTPGRPALDGLRVLVAEDHPVNMLIVGTMLRRLGAEVLEAVDGRAAVETAIGSHDRLDAVLMDLHMPVLDGLEAARQLRADPRTATLPLLALSAAVLAHEREQAREAGMPVFVSKPVLEEDLVRALAPLMRRH